MDIITKVSQDSYTEQEVSAWLRGLLTVAWADGHFDEEEKEFIAELTQDELSLSTDLTSLKQTIAPHELAIALGDDSDTAENFLRTAVMIAVADGTYSKAEAELIHQYQEALGLRVEALKSLELTLSKHEGGTAEVKLSTPEAESPKSYYPHSDILHPIKDWLDGMDIEDPRLARFICKTVPSQCPFERDITLFGHKIVHIPPLCKLNPLYEQLVGLRFRALSYLADEKGEDVTAYL